MSRTEQKRIQDIATKALRKNRSKKEILETFRDAGIVDKSGKLKSPYDQLFVQQ